MKPVFCDTVYFVALLNPADRLHSRAVAFSRGADRPLVTTEWVVLEVGDALCRGANRARLGRQLEILSKSSKTEIVPATARRSGAAARCSCRARIRIGR